MANKPALINPIDLASSWQPDWLQIFDGENSEFYSDLRNFQILSISTCSMSVLAVLSTLVGQTTIAADEKRILDVDTHCLIVTGYEADREAFTNLIQPVAEVTAAPIEPNTVHTVHGVVECDLVCDGHGATTTSKYMQCLNNADAANAVPSRLLTICAAKFKTYNESTCLSFNTFPDPMSISYFDMHITQMYGRVFNYHQPADDNHKRYTLSVQAKKFIKTRRDLETEILLRDKDSFIGFMATINGGFDSCCAASTEMNTIFQEACQGKLFDSPAINRAKLLFVENFTKDNDNAIKVAALLHIASHFYMNPNTDTIPMEIQRSTVTRGFHLVNRLRAQEACLQTYLDYGQLSGE